MQIICESSEHHFLTTLETLKHDPKDWVVVHFALSRQKTHEYFIEDIAQITTKIDAQQTQARTIFDEICAYASGLDEAFLYLFPDNDIIVLARSCEAAHKKLIHELYYTFSDKLGAALSTSALLSGELYKYQKLADRKMLIAERFKSYAAIADTHKVSSIAARRERREDPIVMLIEDDRFTATYATGILNKEYELIVCKNGECGITRYVETAPDIVLLDIHLPGLSGHETLMAIKAIDPDAFVVMMSIDTVRDSIVKASSIGAKSFLKKPFTRDRLIHAVKTSPFITPPLPLPAEMVEDRAH